MENYIGYVAACLTTLAFIPQAALVVRTGNTEGVSLSMYIMITVGVASWFVYGYLNDALPIMLSNGTTLVLASIILVLKLRAMFKSYRQARAHGASTAMSAPICS